MPSRHPPIPSIFSKVPSSSSSSARSSPHNASPVSLAPVRPLSIAELADKANQASDALPFSPAIPIRRYLNGANTLRRQAAVYNREGDRESEFVCLVKCARLLIELLPSSHPQYKSLDPETRAAVKRDGQELLDAISDAKSALANRYEAWNALDPEAKAAYRQAGSDLGGGGGSSRSRADSRSSREGSATSNSTPKPSSASNAPPPPSPRRSHRPAASTSAPASARPKEEPSIPFKKPDRGDDGFDVRRILGFGKSSADASGSRQRRDAPAEIPYQPPTASTAFTSSPLDPFVHPHSKAKPKPGSSGSKRAPDIKNISYPILQSKPSSRMSIHQTQQGFAPSSSATARYYQTLRTSETASQPGSGSGSSSGRGDHTGHGHGTTAAMPDPWTHHSSMPFPVPGAPALPPPPPRPTPPPPPHASYAQMPVAQPTGPAPPTLQPKPRSLRGPLPAVPAYPQGMPLPQGVSRDAHGPAMPTLTPHTPHTPTPSSSAAASNVLAQAVQQMTLGTGGRSQALSREAASLLAAAAKPEPDEPIRSYTEGGQPLRSLLVPEEVIGAFVGMSDPNTRANLETCALLQGRLERNRFRVSHLVFPQQTATSDSCTTSNEEEIMAFQEANDLITLGWIHTHPTQSCFLSSLDLHTHAGYQMMLPEAIAIVCSPAHEPSFGLFRLTDPTGLRTVVDCRQPGLFHPHVAEDGRDLALYTDAIYGHVALIGGIGLEIVDLRK
ncbi:uncharacterized protein PFL1_04801 [Pseudozyma flocculosa PF-1]|uniref:MPN domain-containing protein n=2 Tax=Pseudozyma flocculosa TaxID=84751 RepID=A0A5C3F3W7_9BASI|nr:uncharacterized protein PFL1_04801 [Pseudozyma flocculosa PF-1]EPQ27663.1 hypothetical protein PFL1_04801 [Pseudozyma flocculosa PF-1]SPO39204.1 uncharacterized protein PSFLO_04683 [Pseudozyma flocculosa]